ncbi:MAG: DNA-binding Lrp family transcriptional regulator [Halobacteriales archaeon]|jgi:DNA-binding Lrp family transcriptional regulator
MVYAFVMVKTGSGESEGVVEAIRDFGDVVEANIVAGDFDVIVEVETEEVYDVLETVSGAVGSLEGVLDTKTYVSLDE